MTQRAEKLNAILAVQATAHRLSFLLLRAMHEPAPPMPEPHVERVLSAHVQAVESAVNLICAKPGRRGKL